MTKFCGHCGNQLSDEQQALPFCPHCGNRLNPGAPSGASTASAPQLPAKKPVNACPVCGLNDEVKKVSVIYEDGKRDVNFSVPATEVHSERNYLSDDPKDIRVTSTTSYREVTGTNLTALAQRLAPPAAPEEGSTCSLLALEIFLWFGGFMGNALLVFFVNAIFYGSYNSKEPTPIADGPLGLVIYFGAYILEFLLIILPLHRKRVKQNKANAETFRRQTELWRQNMAAWEASYFCFRDGKIFIPKNDAS